MLDIERRSHELLVQSFHLFDENQMVIKTQAIIEVVKGLDPDRPPPALPARERLTETAKKPGPVWSGLLCFWDRLATCRLSG